MSPPPIPKGRYSVTSFTAKPDPNGEFTVTLSKDGSGLNGVPTAGRNFYAAFRIYEPVGDVPVLVANRE